MQNVRISFQPPLPPGIVLNFFFNVNDAPNLSTECSLILHFFCQKKLFYVGRLPKKEQKRDGGDRKERRRKDLGIIELFQICYRYFCTHQYLPKVYGVGSKGRCVVDQTRSILPFVEGKSAQSMKANPIIGDWQTFYRQIHIEGLLAYCLLLSLEMTNNGELGLGHYIC